MAAARKHTPRRARTGGQGRAASRRTGRTGKAASRRSASARHASSATRRPARTTRHAKAAPGPARSSSRTSAGKKWSARVMQRSDALDLEPGVFKKGSARQVALSLKRSAERSRRRKSSPFRSAMSMLNFEINRGGRNLPAARRRVLEDAKTELRKAFGRPQPSH